LYADASVVGTIENYVDTPVTTSTSYPRQIAQIPVNAGDNALESPGNQEVSAGRGQFPHRWAVLFLDTVVIWNFLGAGIFGFLVNLPMVSYYQIGTQLTANHGHASFIGVYITVCAGRP
jgi:hypothetical protein